ncbi:S1C family serine protease [Prosthecobacter vanneervenii]|uniref:PDZ domain-containing protein n=1 Tax=Prosthecobacter vanneervenii TaxID=48466 RepID=A0A7W7Y756_9BACT|nr:PDZ domain-containing protein [Prosthecobacter vanneervenii]MBB5030839.1 hypothetical protein [Prosthecobacter vanneervenii]
MKMACMLLFACISATFLSAQQVDSGTQAGGTNASAPPGRGPEPQSHSEQKLVPYISVLTREVPAELRAQISLQEGFGLLVSEVIPDSPAKAAGIKVHDVLVKFDDQRLVNMEQLMALVHSRKKGDVVSLSVISGGKETQITLTLGEHEPRPADHQSKHEGFFQRLWPRFNSPQQHGGSEDLGSVKERLERLKQELREFQERMQQWSENGAGSVQQIPNFKPGAHSKRRNETGITVPPGSSQRLSFQQSHNSTSVTRRDDSGEYILKNEDGKKIFTVRPPNGPEQSWPIETEEQREAIPEKFRDKLKLMDGPGSGVRIEVHPVPEQGAPKGGASAPALPASKGKTTSA